MGYRGMGAWPYSPILAVPSSWVPGWAPDWAYNAATAKLASGQVASAVEQCAGDTFRAGGGRITMEQAWAQCAGDTGAIVAINNRNVDLEMAPVKVLLVGAFLVGALYMMERR
jgi:hypothetical protein